MNIAPFNIIISEKRISHKHNGMHDVLCSRSEERRVVPYSIPFSFDITRGSSLVVTHRTADVRVMLDRPGTP